MTVEIKTYNVHGVVRLAKLVGMPVGTFKKRITSQQFPSDHPHHCPVSRDPWGGVHGDSDEMLLWACRVGIARPVLSDQENQENRDDVGTSEDPRALLRNQ